MKKLTGMIFVSVVAIFLLFAIDAGAGSYEFSATPSNLGNLDQGRYYTWGINWSALEGETITSASLTFHNISSQESDLCISRPAPGNPDPPASDLYVHLLDSVADGTDSPESDLCISRPAPENPDPPSVQLLEAWNNISTRVQTITYDFDQSELALLFEYSENNNFGLGFNPNCHLNNDGVTLRIETTQVAAVPEPCTALLFGFGLMGFAAFRRKIRKRA